MDKKIMDELLGQGRKADKEDKAMAQAFIGLLRSDGWAFNIQLLNATLQACSDQLLIPSDGIGGVLKSEFIKGAMFGLVLARDRPSAIIDAMKAVSASDQEDDAQ